MSTSPPPAQRGATWCCEEHRWSERSRASPAPGGKGGEADILWPLGMLLHVRVIRLRHDGPEAPPAASSARCCGSRPPRTGLRLEDGARVHVALEAREAGLVMPRNVVEISRDGSARGMGCQYSTAASPDAGVDAANGAQFSFSVEESSRPALGHSAAALQQHAAASGAPLTLSFTLQPRNGGRKAPARAELDATALLGGSKTFAGWLPLRPKPSDANAVAELLVEVGWLDGSCAARVTVQLVAGDAGREIAQRFSLLEQLGSGSFATVRNLYWDSLGPFRGVSF